MKNFLNATLEYLGLRAPTVSTAITGLEKALTKLEKAEKHHSHQGARHIYAAEQATALAAKHDYAAVRAARIRNKLTDLIA